MTKEELEKEAEEYGIDNYEECIYDDVKGWETDCKARVQAYIDGAEFGYNKAMEEWKRHFMQCSSPFCLDKFSEVKCYGELGNMAKKED